MLQLLIGVKSNSNSPVYMNLIVYYNKDYYHNISPNYPNNEHLIQITLSLFHSIKYFLINKQSHAIVYKTSYNSSSLHCSQANPSLPK